MTINGTDFLDPGLAALLASMAGSTRPRRRVFPGHPAQVAHARRFVQRALADHHAAEDAALLTSELVTNAICHTASGQRGTFEIVISRYPVIVRIAVIDAGAPTVPTLSAPGSLNASGRGLSLVEALARRWGHHGNQHGRTVWFELECPTT
jgi:anti-sigma regulatory factor (Ser/Thr protein kinase)